MNVTRGTPVPPPPPPFEPIVITLETREETTIVRYLCSDVCDVREMATKAALVASSFGGLTPRPTESSIKGFLEALRKGLNEHGFQI